jgi:hypothetical protein
MFTGKFPAGATAFKSDIHYINLGLVGLTSAALAFAPKGLLVDTFAYPFSRISQITTRFFRSFIGREGVYLIFR